MSQIFALSETSAVLEVVLRALHAISLDACTISFDTLCAVVSALKKYGGALPAPVSPRTQLMERLLGFAPLCGIELYVLAGEHNLEELAKSSSSYVLARPLAGLSNELARTMGAHYLKRLYGLQMMRLAELRGLLFIPPTFHRVMRGCTLAEQRRLTGACPSYSEAGVAGYPRCVPSFACFSSGDCPFRPCQDILASSVQKTLLAVVESFSCPACTDTLQKQVKAVILRWNVVSVSSKINSVLS